jgi:hypothetical protein
MPLCLLTIRTILPRPDLVKVRVWGPDLNRGSDLPVIRADRASFEFLLEGGPATSFPREFSLDVLSRYFPGYPTEIRARLGGSDPGTATSARSSRCLPS